MSDQFDLGSMLSQAMAMQQQFEHLLPEFIAVDLSGLKKGKSLHLADITLPDGERAGQMAQTTLFPFTMDGQRLGVRLQPPHRVCCSLWRHCQLSGSHV